MTIAVMAIAPPTRIATIGTSNPPKLMIESTSLIRRLLELAPSLRDLFPDFPPYPALKGRAIIGRPYGALRCSAQGLVELTGIEPVASWLQTRRSPS